MTDRGMFVNDVHAQLNATVVRRVLRPATVVDVRETGELICENIFLVRDGVLCTPPLAAGCLAGITRAVLLDLGFPVSAAKAVPILARTASLLAHLAEEQQQPLGFLLARGAEEAVEYGR